MLVKNNLYMRHSIQFAYNFLLLNYDFQTYSIDEIFNLDKQYFVYFHYMQFYTLYSIYATAIYNGDMEITKRQLIHLR